MAIRLHAEDAALLREAIGYTTAETGFSARLIEKDYFATALDSTRAQRSQSVEPLRQALAQVEERPPGFHIAEPLRGFNNSTQYNAVLSYESLVDGHVEPVSIAAKWPYVISSMSITRRALPASIPRKPSLWTWCGASSRFLPLLNPIYPTDASRSSSGNWKRSSVRCCGNGSSSSSISRAQLKRCAGSSWRYIRKAAEAPAALGRGRREGSPKISWQVMSKGLESERNVRIPVGDRRRATRSHPAHAFLGSPSANFICGEFATAPRSGLKKLDAVQIGRALHANDSRELRQERLGGERAWCDRV